MINQRPMTKKKRETRECASYPHFLWITRAAPNGYPRNIHSHFLRSSYLNIFIPYEDIQIWLLWINQRGRKKDECRFSAFPAIGPARKPTSRNGCFPMPRMGDPVSKRPLARTVEVRHPITSIKIPIDRLRPEKERARASLPFHARPGLGWLAILGICAVRVRSPVDSRV